MFVPISTQHSISRVTANLFLAQNIIKPKDILDKLTAENKLKSYQRKGFALNKRINLTNNHLQVMNDEVIGFLLEEFDSSGKSLNSLKIENIDDQSKARISFETKFYTRWVDFNNRFENDINVLNQTFSFYVEAISLNYIDEFNWNSPSKIPIEEIFNTESDLLNSNFTDSHNGTLVVISQSEPKNGTKVYEEKKEILFNNDLKKVIINHTVGIKLEDYKLWNNDILSLFQDAHNKNKDLLKKILKDSIKEQIHLT